MMADVFRSPPGPPVLRIEDMTLRDYFAAKALDGLLAAHTDSRPLPSENDAAAQAYQYADAMLRERAK